MDDQAGTRMRLLMSAAVAEDFSQNLSDSVKWGKIRRIEQEKYPCVKTYGYRIKDHTYEIYEPEAQIIRLIYKSYLAGQSYCQICKMLMDREITSPGGVKIWKTSTVSYILENEKYKGDLLLQKQTYSDLKYRKRKKVKETTIAEGLQLQVDLGRMDSLREIINTEAIFDKFNDGIFRRVVDKVLIDGKTATFVFCDAMRITRPILQGTENE